MKAKDERPTPQTTGEADDLHAPRKLTFAENAILTVKVFLIVGLVIAALWGLSIWTTPS